MLQTSSGAPCLYLYNGIGNPIGLSTSASTTSVALQYDPYGAATRTDDTGNNGGWTENPYLFQGGLQDRVTGQVKFGQRWYSPTTGTWTQQDNYNAPLDFGNANRYAYAADNPINISDPGGTDFRVATLSRSQAETIGNALIIGGDITDFITLPAFIGAFLGGLEDYVGAQLVACGLDKNTNTCQIWIRTFWTIPTDAYVVHAR